MATGGVCVLVVLLLTLALLSSSTVARKAIFGRLTKRDINGHVHDSHEVRRKHKFVITRWLGVIVVRPAPCPTGQKIDMLGQCRPVFGGGAAPPPPPPAFFIGQYGLSFRDYDPYTPRDRPARLARLQNNVIT